jgi:hypothetical protein
MGYKYYPRALGGAIRRAWKSTGGIPILVTESGIATAIELGEVSRAGALPATPAGRASA